MHVLAIDPGETIGWAYQDEHEIKDLGQLNGMEELVPFLEKWSRPVDVLIVENFEIIPPKLRFMVKQRKKGQAYTLRVIGYLEGWAMGKKLRMIKTSPKDNTMIAKLTGMDPESGAHKDTHWVFAANHGANHLIKLGLKKTALQKSMEK